MKNIIITITKVVMCLSMIACVLLWSCNDDDAPFDPSVRVQPLTITNIDPVGALVGTTITITGTNFSTTPTNNLVTFSGLTGSINAAVKSSSINSITTTVPSGAVTGKITVTTNREETPGADFTVTYPEPSITSVSETSAVEGVEITIEGTNFSPLASENSVKINGSKNIPVSEATATAIKFTIPTGTPVGTSPIIVSVQGVEVSGPDFTLLKAIVLTIPIDDANDDVEEAADGRMTLGSADLELGEFDTASTPDLGLQKIGLRFNGINIPTGVTIASASIQFVADSTPGANPTEMTIFGENVGNAAAYTTDANDLSNRVLTTASAVWSIPEWTGSETGPNQRTVDISSIIQEIVNRGDWADGNSMNLILQATGVSASATQNNVGREAETFESGDGVCVLNIVYLN